VAATLAKLSAADTAQGAAAPAAGSAAALKRQAAAEEAVAAAGLRGVPGETIFAAPLDYIMFRNPPPAAVGGLPATHLRPIAVLPTPTAAEVSAECGALPSKTFASDHVPIAATFEVTLRS
jgi:hypothetical protein